MDLLPLFGTQLPMCCHFFHLRISPPLFSSPPPPQRNGPGTHDLGLEFFRPDSGVEAFALEMVSSFFCLPSLLRLRLMAKIVFFLLPPLFFSTTAALGF